MTPVEVRVSNGDENRIVADLARELVSQAAPQELALFRPTSEAYFKNPAKALQAGRGKDEMLGFGLEAAAIFLTPAALAVAREVVRFLCEQVKQAAAKESGEAVADVVRRMFKKLRPAPAESAVSQLRNAPALTASQMTQIRKLAFDKARQLQIPEPQAALLADSVVGGLVTAPS